MSVNENSFINLKNASHSITAEVVVPKGRAEGVLLAQGGRFGGWSFYVKDGKPTYDYNFLGLKRYKIVADKRLEPGKATIRFDFVYDGAGIGKGGKGRISVNGEKVAEGRIEQTQCCIIALDESADVGMQTGTPTSEDYRTPFTFSGKIQHVVVDIAPGPDSASDEARSAEDEAREKRAANKE
jgi:arylsulfatase